MKYFYLVPLYILMLPFLILGGLFALWLTGYYKYHNNENKTKSR